MYWITVYTYITKLTLPEKLYRCALTVRRIHREVCCSLASPPLSTPTYGRLRVFGYIYPHCDLDYQRILKTRGSLGAAFTLTLQLLVTIESWFAIFLQLQVQIRTHTWCVLFFRSTPVGFSRRDPKNLLPMVQFFKNPPVERVQQLPFPGYNATDAV